MKFIKKYSLFFLLILACCLYLLSSSIDGKIGNEITLYAIVVTACLILIVIKAGYTLKNIKFTKELLVYAMLCLLVMSPPIIAFVINDGLLEYSYKNEQLEFAVFNLIVLILISSFCFVILYKLIKSIDNHFTLISFLGVIALSFFTTFAVMFAWQDTMNPYGNIINIQIIIFILIVISIDRAIIYFKNRKNRV